MSPFAPSTGPPVSWEVDNHHLCCQDLHMNPRRRFVWGTNLSMLPCDILTNVHKSCNPSHFLFACLKCDFASEHESQLRIHNSVHHEIHISNNTQYFSLCNLEVSWFSVVCCPMVRQLCLLWSNFYAPDTLKHHRAHGMTHSFPKVTYSKLGWPIVTLGWPTVTLRWLIVTLHTSPYLHLPHLATAWSLVK